LKSKVGGIKNVNTIFFPRALWYIRRVNTQRVNIPDSSRKRVVVIGGGFGGLNLIKKLRNSPFQVVLVDKQNYHAFQPLLYQVATAGLEPGSIAYPFRKIMSGYSEFYFRMAEVLRINSEEKKLETSIGMMRYDYLVLATGATSNFFGLKSIEEKAMRMKTVAEALDIRSLMLQNLEKAILSSDLKEREMLMSTIIVGGGPTGVELAGALAELRKDILPNDYPDLDIRAMDIHLVEANGRLLKEMSEKSSAHALETLKEMGVDIWLNTRVSEYDGSYITTTDGRKLAGAMLIWAAGVKAQLVEGLSDTSQHGGRWKVNEFNQVEGFSDVFAIGDCAAVVTEQTPNGYPMLAQPAMQQGVRLAENLLRKEKGEEMKPFVYKNLGTMATIGRNRAVTEMKKVNLTGWIAWAAWLLVHVYQLIGFRNKVIVMINWAQNYFRHARDLRLIIRPFQRNK
jgi:NADH:ubiquinone reductase (H+-translocating)